MCKIWMGVFSDNKKLFVDIVKGQKDLILAMNAQGLPFRDAFLP